MIQEIAPPQEILSHLQWRYATKKFDPERTIPDDVWQVIVSSLVLTPSSFGLQPWKFFVICDRTVRQSLLEHSWNQRQVVDASHVVVLTIKTNVDDAEVDRYIQSIADIRNVPLESLAGFSKVIKGFLANPKLDLREWATKQAYIALGQLMTTAAMLGVDACPMEGFVPAKYDELLDLANKNCASVLVCPLGYRAADDHHANLAKVRYPQNEVVEFLG